MTRWEFHDQRQSLSKRAREILSDLTAAAIPLERGRIVPNEYRELLSQGLAFQSHHSFSITDRGREVAERCT